MMAPLKNGLGPHAVSRLASNLERAWPAFDTEGFVASATRGLTRLELKQRVGHVADSLATYLPKDYPEALDIIVRAGETWNCVNEDDPLRGFAAWPLFHFIERHGVDDFKRSMSALRSITHLFSAEFAVRAFIARYPERTFAELTRWTGDSSEHVRRLTSECVRPRLPWAARIPSLISDPAPVLALLEKLKDDPALYVRRSVANNLNDIAKDHPERVLDICETWAEQAPPNRRWIIERATRTLVKDAHPRVWGLLGFTSEPRLTVSDIILDSHRICIGDDLTFTFEITSAARSNQRLAIDYALHFIKANGHSRAKVFKLKVLELRSGQTYSASKRRSFRQCSTRTHYPGAHVIEVMANGVVHARTTFELCEPR